MSHHRSAIIRLSWLLIFSSVLINSWLPCSGFQVFHAGFLDRQYPSRTLFPLKSRHNSFILWSHEDSEEFSILASDGNTKDDAQLPPMSTRRVGGRSKSTVRTKGRDDLVKNTFSSLLRSWRQWTLPILVAGFLLSSLFGRIGRPTQQSYTFYQSNVYETRIVDSDGKIQTSRQETIRTNLPQALRDTQTKLKESNSNLVFTEDDDDIDIQDLEQDMKSIWENLLF
jgi:hypothetical protein